MEKAVSLKNYTKIEVNDATRRAVLAAMNLLTTPSATCVKCQAPPSWATGTHFRGVCWNCERTCDHSTTVTGYIITRSGAQQVQRRCLLCGCGPTKAGHVPRGGSYLDICLADKRDDTTCEHCGGLDGVELHHYAPRNTFPDADNWATGYLCRPCHHLWHRTMNGYLWHRPSSKHAALTPPGLSEINSTQNDEPSAESPAAVRELLGM